MNRSSAGSGFSFDPDGDWVCSWQDKYSSGGNLEQCLDTVRNYIEIDNRNISDVRQQLIGNGYASGDWCQFSMRKMSLKMSGRKKSS